MAKIGAIAVTQPIFLDELGANFKAYVPEALEARVYPIRAMLDAGLTVAFSSDAPVVRNDAPLKGVEAAVLRRTAEGECILPGEAITAEEALYAYTAGAAAAAGESDTRGSIQPGRWADFVVLAEDPTAAAPETIGKIRVEKTYLAGKLVYTRSN
jgi:predicted amidohydrolase YtcJ